jgi:hypothetical protein
MGKKVISRKSEMILQYLSGKTKNKHEMPVREYVVGARFQAEVLPIQPGCFFTVLEKRVLRKWLLARK